MNSDFKTATEQTGLWAGDSGFLIDVKTTRRLSAASSPAATTRVVDGFNKLTTGFAAEAKLIGHLKSTALNLGQSHQPSICRWVRKLCKAGINFSIYAKAKCELATFSLWVTRPVEMRNMDL
ncbi:hypothetical protein ACFZAI_01510 [Achromobacter sp. NPDC008082]|uniref:hypothetical protein n=1 Tax=Achromobacter sp. NPDC008082 TaxID=3363888 RepID=UPI0036E6226B